MRTIAILWLCCLMGSPILAQESAKDDPLIGDKRLSEWKILLTDEDPAIRRHAAAAFSRIGTSNPDIPRLIEELWTLDESARKAAAYRLAKIGPEAVPALCVAIKDRLGFVRSAASLALERIGEPAVPALIQTLGETRSLARATVARTLRNIGPTAEAVPALIQTINEDSYSSARSVAAQALGVVGPEATAALPALKGLLKDPNQRVSKAAADAICKIEKR